MKDWFTLEPDVFRLMNKHYTLGRGGHKIDMVVIHHNAGVLSIDQIWQVWQTRAASAAYQVESGGRIGQLVYDRDTAWHAANANINARSIGIEVSNSAGASADWPITDTAIVEAGKLTAAVCYVYKLGRPRSGGNVRFHREFTSTSCPYHLAPGGKYNQRLMKAATDHYDWMVREASGLNTPIPEEGFLMALSDAEQRELLDLNRRIHHELTYKFQSRYEDPATGEQSEFRDTLVGYALEADKKLETMRVQNEKEN